MEGKKINNQFYDELKENWYEAFDHPIALLRAENRTRAPWILDQIDKHFKNPCRILDVGCGGGFLTNELAKQGHQVYGIDISKRSLDTAQKRDVTKRVVYLHENAYELSFKKHQFDVVSATDLLEHVDDPLKVIHEISRVLRPGGLFFFHTFNRNWLSWLIALKGVAWFVKNSPKDIHLYRLFLKPQEVQRFCQTCSIHVSLWAGLEPKIDRNFFKLLFTREVPINFSFRISSSLRCGYMGMGIKS